MVTDCWLPRETLRVHRQLPKVEENEQVSGGPLLNLKSVNHMSGVSQYHPLPTFLARIILSQSVGVGGLELWGVPYLDSKVRLFSGQIPKVVFCNRP